MVNHLLSIYLINLLIFSSECFLEFHLRDKCKLTMSTELSFCLTILVSSVFFPWLISLDMFGGVYFLNHIKKLYPISLYETFEQTLAFLYLLLQYFLTMAVGRDPQYETKNSLNLTVRYFSHGVKQAHCFTSVKIILFIRHFW